MSATVTSTLTVFSTAYTGAGFWGLAYDPGTQIFYAHDGYGAGSNFSLNSYTSVASFASNTPFSSVTLTSAATGCVNSTPCSPIDGTYFTVESGSVIARLTDNTPALATWNASNGAVQSTQAYPSFNGTNGAGSFNWGR